MLQYRASFVFRLTEVHILNQLQNLSIQKNLYFLIIQEKILVCFFASLIYFLSSRRVQHASFNLSFCQKQSTDYKIQYPKTNCFFFFSRPKKIPFSQNFRPPKILWTLFPRPASASFEGGPGAYSTGSR